MTFRIARLLVIVGFGVYLGISYKDGQMKRVCDQFEGRWNGTICVTGGGS